MSHCFQREAITGLFLSLLLVFLHTAASAQTPAPTAFSYQGFLQQAGSPADGSFDFRFTLYDAAGGGDQVGPIQNRTLIVQSGVFSTSLDFGAVFDRALWLNVEVRPAGGGVFDALTPRTALTSVPYANSISGGTLGNAFFGMNAGRNNTTGFNNAFFGTNAGRDNASGSNNAVFGTSAGLALSGGSWNSFFGTGTGWMVTTGDYNAFFGQGAGHATTTGAHNTFVGHAAGSRTTTGIQNTFLGANAGQNTTDDFNSTGSANTFIGFRSGPTVENLTNATAIGANARVSQSNSLVLGNNANVGIGTSEPGSRLTVAGVIESTTGGIRFPDGTVQTTAGGGGTSGLVTATATHNLFVGPATGQSNTPGNPNPLSGSNNTFVGHEAGTSNTAGAANTFTGALAGRANTTGVNNSFFGNSTGLRNSTGNSNSMFGNATGQFNTAGSQNSFFGNGAGHDNTSGSRNVFIGLLAGRSNTTGNDNTMIGYEANPGAGNLTNATAIGAGAVVSQSNSLVLGNNANVGIGTSAPESRLTVAGVIESTTGGIKFPDGTVQTTAGGGGSGSVNAILNQTTPQTGANFNITGSGVAGVFDAASHFSISGERILSARADLQSLYIGNQTGINATGQNNTFVGHRAGFSMTTGQNNTFFGRRAGHDNTSGGSNVYFGDSAGEYNSGGHSNVALGGHSGQFNQGSFNAFVGWGAGSNNVGGSSNSALGYEANFDAPNLQFATAIGAGAMVASSNTIVLGRAADNVEVPGTLIKSAGSFRIDHPLDPANKYLSHSFVESPDMMNVYNGNIILDGSGEAWIEMPAYFEALNREFRYQITAIGVPGPNLYVADEIAGNRFRIAGGAAGMKVSWQVTGIRKDPYAMWNPIIVEQDKPEAERGRMVSFPSPNVGSNFNRTDP